jgi:hypothetical protein
MNGVGMNTKATRQCSLRVQLASAGRCETTVALGGAEKASKPRCREVS